MVVRGEEAYKLAKEAKRTSDLLITPYNDMLVRTICSEIRTLRSQADQTIKVIKEDSGKGLPSDSNKLSFVMIQHLAVNRDKRVLFAYHYQRANKLREISWNVGMQSNNQRELKRCLSPVEQQFLIDYGQLVNSYKQSFLELDIGGNGGVGLDPPVDVFIEVRVMIDAGEISTEYGVLNLSKGNQFYARRTEVESLVKAGYLKQI
ncbi:subunit of the GINS complex [Pilobolus umbonatus]|nr:subunit of the GINS complex [Pilobolus umbonatus]